MLKKITGFVKKFQAFVGIILAIMAGIIAFNDEMKKHYSEDTQNTQP